MDKILSQFEMGNVSIFTGAEHGDVTNATKGVTIHHADVPRWWPKDWTAQVGRVRISVRLRALSNVVVGGAAGLRAALVLRREHLRAVIAVYPKQHYLLAAYIASICSGKPLIIYFMDVYVEGLSHGRRVSRIIEKLVLRRASLLFGMSEPHVRQLKERCEAVNNLTARVVELPHPHISQSIERGHLNGQPAIVFTGAIYDAQADAIRRLIEAIHCPPLANEEPQLYLYTQSTLKQLAGNGISPGDRVHIEHLEAEAVRSVQAAADILFLPMAFDSKLDVRATAAPSKLPEYLDAKRPILIHAPPDSYISSYALDRGFAEVVSVPSADELAKRISALARDPSKREEVVTRAAETLERHAASSVATLLQESMEEVIGPLPQTSKSPTVVQKNKPM